MDGIREKKFRETSEELGGWSEDRRKWLRVLRSSFCRVKFVYI